MIRTLVIIVSIFIPVILSAQQKEQQASIIFDTDMGPDYDDVGAIALLHALADSGEAKILATIASTGYEGVSAVISTLNTYFNKRSIPVGVPKGKAVMLKDEQHWTDTLLARYPHRINRNDETQNAIDVYRKVLAEQPDNSVTIVTVGFLTNIADLLRSPADQFSELSGKELIKKKVKHLVSMAGKFPSGKEFNIVEDAEAAKFAFENFPRPVIISGFEIGEKVKTGLPLINNPAIQNSPVKDVFRICINMREEDRQGRMSWDQTAVLVAVKGYAPFYALEYGTITIAPDGTNTWDTSRKKQARLVQKMPPEQVQHIINTLMMHQPVDVKGK